MGQKTRGKWKERWTPFLRFDESCSLLKTSGNQCGNNVKPGLSVEPFNFCDVDDPGIVPVTTQCVSQHDPPSPFSCVHIPDRVNPPTSLPCLTHRLLPACLTACLSSYCPSLQTRPLNLNYMFVLSGRKKQQLYLGLLSFFFFSVVRGWSWAVSAQCEVRPFPITLGHASCFLMFLY